ncbi:SurA N-terminal domain-containing protein [Sulfuricystis thermophila]|uniref:SurA N-terminal domain-containing protein n=1 Tax=Sulfuricystis thermophila TaxID=2496847 RepID=UPI001036694E|nr:SurA N-terminal domain-containing protein [Sulfuricystis thermophila]
MFDFVRNNKKVVQLVLAIIILPFALWGVDSYIRGSGGGANEIARVGKSPISRDEFQRALTEQQERLRPQLGNNTALLDSPEIRRGVLQELINQRALHLHAAEAHMGISNEMLAAIITSLPALQVDGKFSRERYETMVAGQNMSIAQFEAMLRRDLITQQQLLPIPNASFTGKLPVERWLIARLEERDIAEAMLPVEQFLAASKPDAQAVQRYYDENRARFEQPEQVRVEYLVLSRDKLIENAKVSEAEIKAFYEANLARYRTPEQRRASHILIRVEKNASADEVKAAEEKARQILAEVRAKPDDFARLAKAHSQDPGSAAKGGDLGFFGRGMMVKPFEEAVFSLQDNQLSDLVRSDFGFHIIKLTGIRPEQARKFDEVRGEIEAELKRQAGAKQYVEAAEGFANLAYEQADSLKPAAEKYGLTIQTSDWLAKDGHLSAPFTNPKLLQAIFSEDALKNRRNTEAIETAPNMLVAARVIDHRPAELLPLEKVAGMIEQVLSREAALAKAAEAGEAELAKLRGGEKSTLTWGTVRAVSRQHAPEVGADALAAIFAVDAKQLPAYTGVKTPKGFALYRVDRVRPFDPTNPGEAAPRAQALQQQYNDVVAREELIGWLAALREHYGVTINSAALERK